MCLINHNCSHYTQKSFREKSNRDNIFKYNSHVTSDITPSVLIEPVLLHCRLDCCSLPQDPPYMMLKPDSAFLAGNERFEGYLADILKRLATSVGFEYEIRLSRDGKHGDLHMDTIWDGMMGDIQRGVSIN